jgi:hypothetical protein
MSSAVERPEVISRYFQYSDVVDSHNHARQALLGLEKKWATQNCWFRLNCGFIGITLAYSWKAFKIGAPVQSHPPNRMVVSGSIGLPKRSPDMNSSSLSLNEQDKTTFASIQSVPA